MNNNLSIINFKGYDVRPLKGYFMTTNEAGIGTELENIGKKEGFKLYSISESDYTQNFARFIKEGFGTIPFPRPDMWVQDVISIVKGKLLYALDTNYFDIVSDYFKLMPDETETNARKSTYFKSLLKKFNGHSTKPLRDTHITGGNFYMIKNGSGADELLIGKEEMSKFSESQIKTMLGVEKIIVLPYMDYHIDLFVRPLENKKILLADDTMTLDILEDGYSKAEEYLKNCPNSEKYKVEKIKNSILDKIDSFVYEIIKNPYAKSKEVENVLKTNGYDVIKVPGRIYNFDASEDEEHLSHSCNYINANVIKNNDGELVYITNKSYIDLELGLTKDIAQKIGFSFEDAFINSLAPYVKRDKVYFITGERSYIPNVMLPGLQGGIHCACTEIPDE